MLNTIAIWVWFAATVVNLWFLLKNFVELRELERRNHQLLVRMHELELQLEEDWKQSRATRALQQ